MQRILSIKNKDFESGFSTGLYNTKLGLFFDGPKINPFIREGSLAWSSDPVELGAGTVVGIPQSFCVNGADMYSNDASGNIYKIAYFLTTATVTKTKTGLTNTYGLEVLQTKNSLKYLYYFQKTQIGRMKLSDATYDDDWTAITAAYQSDVNPTLRITDEIYFGSKNVISKIADNGSNDTVLVENVLDLPTDYTITSLSTDGYYLIIVASKSVSSTIDYCDSRVYFWDYKNNYDSWTRDYLIPDPQIRGIKTIDGVSYAVGQYGLYYFSFSKEPERIREDVNCSYGFNNMSTIRNAISFADEDVCVTYGKLKAGSKTALFKPYTLPANITAMDTSTSNTFGFFGTTGSKIYRQSLFGAQTTYGNQSFLTGRIDLDGYYAIKGIEIIFDGKLSSADSFTVALQANTNNVSFGDVAYSTFDSLGGIYIPSTVGDVMADYININISNAYGTFTIKDIHLYGERITR